ncbi:MAG: alpha/beta fold hydrolase [Paracoccus sp. (in: a-proteobacteria)]|nr:alpha/beta fold hydrolase [Paracoccus sp. (in: a-proteobacteria)]
MPQTVSIEAKGATLSGLFYPPQGKARAHLVLHGATGVPQGYYAGFAQWAAAQGVGVLTYDYRDFGASTTGAMRHARATMADWAVHDQEAAERALRDLAPLGPLLILGHSIGGLGLAFRRQDARVAGITTIGSGFAHVADHPMPYLLLVLSFWYGPGPLATALAGYLPGRRLMLGADLPAEVYWQWRRWCTRRGFWADDIGVSLPPPEPDPSGPPWRLMVSADDRVVPPDAVWRYGDTLDPGRVTRHLLNPADFGLRKIGHIEAFSRRNQAIWPVLLGDLVG